MAFLLDAAFWVVQDATRQEAEGASPVAGEAPSRVATPDLATETHVKTRPRARANGRGVYPRESADSSSTSDTSEGEAERAQLRGEPDQADAGVPYQATLLEIEGGGSAVLSPRVVEGEVVPSSLEGKDDDGGFDAKGFLQMNGEGAPSLSPRDKGSGHRGDRNKRRSSKRGRKDSSASAISAPEAQVEFPPPALREPHAGRAKRPKGKR